MGYLPQMIGKLDEAEPYCREAVESTPRVLGDDNPRTLSAISSMGDLLEATGKLEEAEPYYREALEGNRCVLDDDQPDTLISIHSMVRMLRDLGRLEEAEKLCAEAVRGAKVKFGLSKYFRLAAIPEYGRTLAARKR